MLFLAAAAAFAASTYAFVSPSSATRKSRAIITQLTATAAPDSTSGDFDDGYDVYDDLLNLSKPVEGAEFVNAWSIDASKDQGLPVVWNRMSPGAAKKPEWWDDFYEESFSDMDTEPQDSEKWMLEVRDEVEKKRGFAIWSKKSDKELQREMKKTLATKALNVPESSAMVIRAVHLEKSHTMKQMRKDYELECIELRKWMIEQRKKSKKDPLPAAKTEVSKKWLTRHPNTSLVYSRNPNKPPPVVMDDKAGTVYGNGGGTASVFGSAVPSSSTMAGSSTSGGPTAAGGSVSGVVGSTSSKSGASNTITTSMIHWETARDDLPTSMTVDAVAASAKLNARGARVSDGAKGVFFVDGEEMFVATKIAALAAPTDADAEDDYYVVL